MTTTALVVPRFKGSMALQSSISPQRNRNRNHYEYENASDARFCWSMVFQGTALLPQHDFDILPCLENHWLTETYDLTATASTIEQTLPKLCAYRSRVLPIATAQCRDWNGESCSRLLSMCGRGESPNADYDGKKKLFYVCCECGHIFT